MNLMVNKSGISWKSDREHKFGKDVLPQNFQNNSIIGGGHLDESIPVSTYMISCFDESIPEAEPNNRKIGKLCDYASKNPLRIPKITDSLEKMCYKDLRNEVFGSVKVVFCVYRKLLSSCKEQMSLFAGSLLEIIRTLLEQTRIDEIRILGCNTLSDFIDCRVFAWSLFNDTYSFSVNGMNLIVNKSGISWQSDREHKFGKDVLPQNFQNNSIIGGGHLDESIPEDLIVWMRTAALPTFRKLYGRIKVDLKVSVIIYVTLKNKYNTYSFDGKKKLMLSTTSWLGGNNDFIGIVYLTIGGLCLFLALFFTVVVFVKPRYLQRSNLEETQLQKR
ncbi:hypothetical protein RYX36_001259 [Vicia faba]